MRVANDHPTRNGGWLHRLKSDERRLKRLRGVRTRIIRLPDPARVDFSTRIDEYQRSVNRDHLEELAAELGVKATSLIRLGIGWSWAVAREATCDPMMRAGLGAWAFPMFDGGGKVIGIKLRLPNGHKFDVKGSNEGQFVPADLPARVPLLLFCEGASDTAAMLDMGLMVVGRPSCTSGVRSTVELVEARKTSDVVIVADADDAGRRGARSLATALAMYVPRVRIIEPPQGVNDARAWRLAGATAADVERAIDAAPAWELRMTR